MTRNPLIPLGKVVIGLLFIVLIILAVFLLPDPARSDPLMTVDLPSGLGRLDDPDVVWTASYIRYFLQERCQGHRASWHHLCHTWATRDARWDRAPELAELIVRIAKDHKLEIAEVVVVIRAESSFSEKTRTGAAGEQGLMQVHGQALKNALAAGYDMHTSEGQLNAGCLELARLHTECSTTLKVFQGYQSGSCNKEVTGARYRLRLLERARTLTYM